MVASSSAFGFISRANGQSWGATRNEHADEFLNVACGQCDTSSETSVHSNRSQLSSFSSMLIEHVMQAKLTIQVVLLAVCAPVMFWCVLMPLAFKGPPLECWIMYYFSIHFAVAVQFAEGVACLGFGNSLGLGAKVIVVGIGLAVVFVALVSLPCTLLTITITGVVLFCLSVPGLMRIPTSCWEGLPKLPAIVHMFGMTYGGLPTAVSVIGYVLSEENRSMRSGFPLVGALVVWCSAPFLVKPLGRELFTWGCPSNKFLCRPLWDLYVESAFGTMGLVVFMHSPGASIMYAVSVVPVLVVHLLRGLPGSLRCVGWRNNRIARAGIFLEAFGSVLGRAVAYTLYFCSTMADSAAGDDFDLSTENRWRMFDSTPEAPISVHLYRRVKTNGATVAATIFGQAALWSTFAAFCHVLPLFWREVAPVEDAATAGMRATKSPAASDSLGQAELLGHSIDPESSCSKRTNAWEEQAEPSSRYSADSWLPADKKRTIKHQQNAVLVAFIRRNMRQIMTSTIFQVMISIAGVNLAETILDMNGKEC